MATILYGSNASNTRSGTGGADHLFGWAQIGPDQGPATDHDTLYGRGGDDKIEGGNGDDRLYGEAGYDQLYGGAGNDQLYGGTESDQLYGGLGDDLIYGGAGQDFLFSGGGGDQLFGEAGEDFFTIAGAGMTVAWGGDDNDTFDANRGQLDGGAGDDLLRLDLSTATGAFIMALGGPNELTALDGSWFRNFEIIRITGSGFNDQLIAGSQADEIHGAGGDDSLDGGAGDDWLTGGEGGDDIFGGAGSDLLEGDGGGDDLRGGADNDSLNGKAGLDNLFGEGGNDTLYVGTSIDGTLASDWGDSVDGGDGIDVLSVTFNLTPPTTALGAWVVDLTNPAAVHTGPYGLSFTNVERLQILNAGGYRLDFTGGAESDFVTIVRDYGDIVRGGGGSDAFSAGTGSTMTVTFMGEDGNDSFNVRGGHLLGGAGNDNISSSIAAGNARSDVDIDGGDGDDNINIQAHDILIHAGAGADDIVASFTATYLDTQMEIFGGDGDDTVQMTSSFGGWAWGEAGNDQLTGTNSADRLFGGDGNDILNGAQGNDIIDAGTGADVVDGGFQTDTLILDFSARTAGETISLVAPSVLQTLSTGGSLVNVEILDFMGGSGVDTISLGSNGGEVDGGGGADVLSGAGGTTHLIGGAGGDTLTWNGAGSGLLDGGADNDLIQSNNGALLAHGDGGGDVLNGAGANDLLHGDDGDDALSGGGGLDTLLGGAGADDLVGGDGADVLEGGAGDDSLLGGLGNDTLIYYASNDGVTIDGGADSLDGGDGDDYVFLDCSQTSAVIETIFEIDWFSVGDVTVYHADTVELLSGSGNDTISAGGGGPGLIDGGGGNDLLVGNGESFLWGGDGNDQLEGVIADFLDGGPGNDLLVAHHLLAFGPLTGFFADGGEGVDRLQLEWMSHATGVSFTAQASDQISTLGAIELTGIEAFTLTGGSGADSLTLGGGDDIVDGGLGGDILSGGDGIDRLTGGGGDDNLTGGAGADIFVVANDGADMVTDFQLGSDRIDVSHYEFYETLVQSGADTLITFDGGAATLRLLNVTASAVTPASFIGLAAPTPPSPPPGNVQINGTSAANSLVGGMGAETIRGFEANDVLSGAGGDDWLEGGAGADRMNGGAANDTLVGGAGADIMTGGVGADRFYWFESTDSGIGPAADSVSDFNQAQGDVLDFSYLDAVPALGGDQAFTQVGAFSGSAGQMVRTYDGGTNITLLSFDLTGDGVADMQVKLTGNIAGGWVL